MNAVIKHETPRLPSLSSGGTVRAIVPQDFDGVWRIANAVVKAGMAPKGLETPEKAMVAIMHGMEVGMPPMAALQSIAVINGRPSIWGDGALGLVQSSGLMESHKEWLEGSGDTRKAVCTVKRKGDQEIKTGEFSVADAKNAHLWGKSGPWSQYSDRMLKMRARSFALRDGFSDVLRGLSIAEEAQDFAARDILHQTSLRPPSPPSPSSYQDPIVIDGTSEVSEVGQEKEPIDYGDYFERMQEAMLGADNEVVVEEVWNDFDPETVFKDDADSFELASKIKQNRLVTLHPINAG